MRFDWTDLQLFVHACEGGSLTVAAERSHLTLAAASARVRGMEEQAGSALLARHSRGVRPTAAGDALLRHAQAVLAQMAQLHGELAQHGRGARGRVRLMCNTSALVAHLPAALASFLQDNPQVDVVVEESASHVTVQALRQGVADFGIVSSAVDTTGLYAVPLCDDPLAVVLPRGHALAKQRRLAFAEVLDHDLVGYGITSALHAHLSLHAAHSGRAMKLRANLGSFDGLCQLVAQGVGMAVIPALAVGQAQRPVSAAGRAKTLGTRVEEKVRPWGLTLRPLSDGWARRSLLLCCGKALPAASPARRLFDALLAASPSGPAATGE